MNNPVHDYFVTLAPSDTGRLAAACRDREKLEDFPTWSPPTDARFLMRMGENLFHLAFPSKKEVQELVSAFATAVRRDAILRLWLYAGDPQVAMLPWEYLCLTEEAVDECRNQGVDLRKYQPHTSLPNEQTFLALNPHISLVRQASPQPPQEALERLGALRILIVWSNPASPQWPLITGLEVEVSSILNDLRGLPASHCEVRVLARATRAELARVMRQWRPHVLHYAGHGGFPGAPDDPGDLVAPSLVLEGKHGAQRHHDYLTAGELRQLCIECGVQVVVLNACWGGHTTPNFPGIAYSLTASGGPAGVAPVPVVVAMHLPIPQSAAVGLAAPFYQNVVVARAIEEGVRTFRRDSTHAHPYGCGAPDWGVPVVFLGVRQSALFRAERVDAYPLNFGELIQRHVPIVGRQFVREKLEDFARLRSSGIFLFTAPPGVGKTAFQAQWVTDHPHTVHFFYRATVGVTDPDECVKSLYQELLAKLGIQEVNPTADPVELRRKFERLLEKVSNRCNRTGEKEVLIVDALDEAGKTRDGQTAVDVLPVKLPPHVYLLITSRTVPLADRLARLPHVYSFDIDPSSAANQSDAMEFCRRELQGRVTDASEETLRRLSERLAIQAKGNFLVLKLGLSRESLGEQLTLAELERLAAVLTEAVEQRYVEFFDRVKRRLDEDPDRLDLLYRVLGAFVTAQAPVTPEQVSAAFNLGTAHRDWAFGLIGQFLERGGVRQEERGVLTYRLYHETFREFLWKHLAADLRGCHGQWANYCLGWRKLNGYARLYALRHLVTHLIGASREG